MKIAFLTTKFPPYIGGDPLWVYRIAKGLTQKGHNISVYTTIHPDVPSVEKSDGIKIERHYEINPRISSFIKAPTTIMPSLFKLFDKEEMLNIEAVHSFDLTSFFPLLATSLKLFRKKRFIHTGSFPLLIPYYTSKRRWPFFLYSLTFGIAILRYADILIARTNLERGRLLQFGIDANKIQIIPGSIDSSSYKQLPDPTLFRKKYRIAPHERIILFVGKPTLWKGVDHLVIALQDVLKRIKKARLVIVGPLVPRMDNLLRSINSNVAEHILITGPLMGDLLLSAYSAADTFVLTSLIETFGMVILEAAAAGLPIVSTKTGVAPDIIINNKNGLFVRYGDVNQISSAIIKILTDENFKNVANRRREFILRNYDVKTELDQYEKVYKQCLK
jgi:glycosyltransferase involved in cell wall biosynthesis